MGGERLTVSVLEASKLLGISKGLAFEAVRRGEIPALRVGRRWLVPVAALARLLEAAGQPRGKGKGQLY